MRTRKGGRVIVHANTRTAYRQQLHRWFAWCDVYGIDGSPWTACIIGQCLIRLPDVYRPWRKEAGRDIPTDNVVSDDRGSPHDIETTVVQLPGADTKA